MEQPRASKDASPSQFTNSKSFRVPIAVAAFVAFALLVAAVAVPSGSLTETAGSELARLVGGDSGEPELSRAVAEPTGNVDPEARPQLLAGGLEPDPVPYALPRPTASAETARSNESDDTESASGSLSATPPANLAFAEPSTGSNSSSSDTPPSSANAASATTNPAPASSSASNTPRQAPVSSAAPTPAPTSAAPTPGPSQPAAPVQSAAPSPSTTRTPTTTTTTSPVQSDNRPVLYVSPSGSDDRGGGLSVGDALRTPDFAVREADAGDTIHILPGDYDPMTISDKRDLVVVAPQGAVVFSSGRYDQSAGVLIEDSRDIVVEGMKVEFSLWGLRVYNSHGIVLRNNEVFNVGQEAIHVLNRSSDVLIEGNRVDLTGQREGSRDGLPYWARGEGIYLGTGGLLSGGAVDDVSNVQVIGNHLSRISAEAVEIKASVYDVLVRGNIIHDVDLHSGAAISIGRGTRTYDASVIVEYNTIWNVTSRESRRDGIGVRVSSPAIVRNNAIWDTEHYGVRIDDQLRNVNGAVIVENNVISDSGISDVFNESGGTGVPVTIRGNIDGSQADQFIGSNDASTLISRLQAM